MAIINLTPHSIDIYPDDAFQNLEQLNPTTWVADSVNENMAYAVYPSDGVLRITTKTTEIHAVEGIPTVETVYGDLQGLPENYDGEWMIVSLPCQSMAKQAGNPLAAKMLAPYNVVRLRSNTSQVLGCMGFTK